VRADLDVASFALGLVRSEPLDLDFKAVMTRCELVARRSKSLMIDQELLINDLGELVLTRRFPAVQGAGVLSSVHRQRPFGRNRFRSGTSWHRLGNDEDRAALLAAHLVADVRAANAQGRLTIRARDRDTFGRRDGMGRPPGRRFRPTCASRLIDRHGTKRSLAVFADDLQSDVLAINPQARRTVRTIRDEVRAGLAHEQGLPVVGTRSGSPG
jgi:hypothetical protein